MARKRNVLLIVGVAGVALLGILAMVGFAQSDGEEGDGDVAAEDTRPDGLIGGLLHDLGLGQVADAAAIQVTQVDTWDMTTKTQTGSTQLETAVLPVDHQETGSSSDEVGEGESWIVTYTTWDGDHVQAPVSGDYLVLIFDTGKYQGYEINAA